MRFRSPNMDYFYDKNKTFFQKNIYPKKCLIRHINHQTIGKFTMISQKSVTVL